MRARSAVLIGLTVLSVPALSCATAGAATLVTEGIAAARTGDRLDLTFTPAALAAAKLKAKSVVEASCSVKRPDPLLAFDDREGDDDPFGVYGQGAVAADGTVKIDLFSNGMSGNGEPLPSFDACVISRVDRQSKTTSVTQPVAEAALTPPGAVWVDESARAVALHDLLTRAATATGYAAAASLGGVVALTGPDATPAAGQIGYWTDGRRATVVAVSAAGRRLVAEDLGRGMLRTNVINKLDVFGEFLTDLTIDDSPLEDGTSGRKSPENDGRGSPYTADDPLEPKDGVRASRTGRRLVVRFTGRSARTYRALAGRKVAIVCFEPPAPSLFPRLGSLSGDVVGSGYGRVAPHGGEVVFRLSAAKGALCLLADDGTLVAEVAPTAAGRVWYHDLSAVLRLLAADTDHLIAAGGKAYRPTADAVKRSRGLVAMAGPAGPVAAGKVGVWTDGAGRAVVAARSAGGRTFVVADDGGLARSNVFGELTGLWLALTLGDEGGAGAL